MKKELQLKNISCGYGTKKIIDNFTAKFVPGEFVGILGANGSGKTTLLKAITGILPLISGEILYQGGNIKAMSRKKIAENFAFVSQDREGLYYKSTVMDIVMLGRLPYLSVLEWDMTKKNMDSVEEALKYTKLDSIKNKEIDTLSGGERQRVFIAKAISQDPSVLILDEPTIHLDLGHSIEIFELISRMKKEKNITVIAVIHDINLACRFCDRIIMIKNGAKICDGSTDNIINRENIKNVFGLDVNILKNNTGNNLVRISY